MTKPVFIRKLFTKAQLTTTFIVIICYTYIIGYFTLQGFKEAHHQFLLNEAEQYSKRYDESTNTPLPHTANITGYLGWNSLPQWIQNTVSRPKGSNKSSFRRIRYIDGHVTSVFWPDKTLFLLSYPLNDGKSLYLTRIYNVPSDISYFSNNRFVTLLLLTWPIGLAIGLIMHLMARHFAMKTLNILASLGDWADSLRPRDLDKPIPDFQFEEINRVARLQKSSFVKVTQLIEKEKSFLRHTSHELRTPIAIMRNNGELLEKLANEDSKYAASIARVNRAALNIQHITETLLWLSSDDQRQLKIDTVNMFELIESIIEDNQYLLENKVVHIEPDISTERLNIEAIPCQLVINNIMRNAFQYTQQGIVKIAYSNHCLMIENNDISSKSQKEASSDYGYGLGLQLVERIVDKMGWQYQNEVVDGGHKVLVLFVDHPTESGKNSYNSDSC